MEGMETFAGFNIARLNANDRGLRYKPVGTRILIGVGRHRRSVKIIGYADDGSAICQPAKGLPFRRWAVWADEVDTLN